MFVGWFQLLTMMNSILSSIFSANICFLNGRKLLVYLLLIFLPKFMDLLPRKFKYRFIIVDQSLNNVEPYYFYDFKV